MRRHRLARPRCMPCSRICGKPRRKSSASAPIKHRRADALGAIQSRFYEAGGEVTRIEQSIQFTRELRQRQRSDLEQAEVQVADLGRFCSGTAASRKRWRWNSRPWCPVWMRRTTRNSNPRRLGKRGAGAGGVAGRPGMPMRRRSRSARARRGSNAPASSSWRVSSGACCSSRSARRASARRWSNCSRRWRWRLWRAAPDWPRMRVRRRRPSCRSCWRRSP